MDDLIFIALPAVVAIVCLIAIVVSAIRHAIWVGNGNESDPRKVNHNLYLALGLFPITSVFGFHILSMCTSKGAKILHLVLRVLLIVSTGLMAATMKCPAGASCAVTLGALFVVPNLVLLLAIYLFTAAEAIIAFLKAKK